MLPPKGVYLTISKLLSILAVVNLLAHNNKSQICYCGQISLQSAAVFPTISFLLGVTFSLLEMVLSSTLFVILAENRATNNLTPFLCDYF